MSRRRKTNFVNPITFDVEIVEFLDLSPQEIVAAGEKLRDLGYRTRPHISVHNVIGWQGRAPEKVVKVLGEGINEFYDYCLEIGFEESEGEDYYTGEEDEFYYPMRTHVMALGLGLIPDGPSTMPADMSIIYQVMKEMHPDAVSGIVTVCPVHQPEYISSAYVEYLPETDEVVYEYGTVMMMAEIEDIVPVGGVIIRVFHPTDTFMARTPDGEVEVPRKIISGVQVEHGAFYGLTSGQIMDASCTDAETKDIMPPEEGVHFKGLDHVDMYQNQLLK